MKGQGFHRWLGRPARLSLVAELLRAQVHFRGITP